MDTQSWSTLYHSANISITELIVQVDKDLQETIIHVDSNKRRSMLIDLPEPDFIEMCKQVLDQLAPPVAPKPVEYEYKIEEITDQPPGSHYDSTAGQWETMNLITGLERFTVDSWELINVTWRGAREIVHGSGVRQLIGYYVCVLRREKRKGE